jgi:hypothetical protein
VGLLTTQLSDGDPETDFASQNRHQGIPVSTVKPTKPHRRAPRRIRCGVGQAHSSA